MQLEEGTSALRNVHYAQTGKFRLPAPEALFVIMTTQDMGACWDASPISLIISRNKAKSRMDGFLG